MKESRSYPFYRSLRFRFGLFFGLLFFLVLLAFIFIFYERIRTELEEGFKVQLTAGAELVLQKTSVNPLVIPLPQGEEKFELSYKAGNRTDTVYSNLLSIPARTITSSRDMDAGVLSIRYALPDDELRNSLASWQRLLFIYLPLAFLLSLILGYSLSGVLLRPIRQIITKAGAINLQDNIQLLPHTSSANELVQLTEALNRLLGRIRQHLLEQNGFFASASHELRTPLSTMLTELQVIEAGGISDELKDVIQSQKAEVERLIRLVNNFLYLSQSRSTAAVTQRAKVDLLDACMDNADRLQTTAEARGQRFRFSVMPEDAGFEVIADRQQVDVILANLFSNAIRYGDADSVIIIVLTKTSDAIQIAVSNSTQISIPDLSKLGTQFYRGEGQQDGFGLGLWIVKRLLQNISVLFHLK